MKEFLRSVAEHYFAQLPVLPNGKPDYLHVTDYLFVFPSRRSGLFFNAYLQQLCGQDATRGGHAVFAPQQTTIADLFSDFSETRVPDHTELLLRLYKVYRRFKEEDFENFIFWGEMLLSDFEDVDRYLIDAHQLFANVKDLKEIDDAFAGFEDEQKELIESFWKHLGNKKSGPAQHNFVQTWSILADVYMQFRESLAAEHLAYGGMREREVVEKIPTGALDEALDRLPKHIVFVGITAINAAERALFRWLRDVRHAEFCWDYADPHLQPLANDGVRTELNNPANAAYFSKTNLEEFPNVLSESELSAGIVPQSERKFYSMAVPSGVGQTREAARILRHWNGGVNAIDTAVVLPDEHMLVPMLYAIPGSYSQYNVTMGYSLRSTQAAALVDALCQLQNNYRQDRFYYKAVLQVLAHPYLLNLEPDVVPGLANKLQHDGFYQVPVDMLTTTHLLGLIFTPVQTIDETATYLDRIFAVVGNLQENKVGPLERESLLAYRKMLSLLLQQVKQTGIEQLSRNAIFRLLQRLAQGQTVNFSGEPLSGLQVMGILETRAVDFRRVIILSMNEGVFPSKPSQNSFVPNNLRVAFGLPTQKHKDSVIAYHFYRLLSRASEVCMLYDSRSGGLRSGEVSRYLLQLKYLDNVKIVPLMPQQDVATEEPVSVEVKKSPAIMEKLSAFCSEQGTHYLSASSLKRYIACPLQFYFADVERLREDEGLEDELNDAHFGDILHHAMENLYHVAEGRMIQADFFKSVLAPDSVALKAAIEKGWRTIVPHAEMSGYQQLNLALVEKFMRYVLQYDAQLTPFTYLASECSEKVPYQVNDSLRVNLMAVYDRLDIVMGADGKRHLRVVDYKTGSPNDKLKVSTIDSLFAPKGASKEAFQVMFYCLMLKYASSEALVKMNLLPHGAHNAYDVCEPNLYFTRIFSNASASVQTHLYLPEDKKSKTPQQNIVDFDLYRDDFETGLRHLIEEIFDPEKPFVQTEDTHTCEYCAFRTICVR